MESSIARKMAQALANLGMSVESERVIPRWRDWRWVASIGSDAVCFYADTECAAVRLACERRLLNALAGRIECVIPEILCARDDDTVQLRSAVIGDQVQDREAIVGSAQGGKSIARSYARAIASLHQAIDRATAATLVQPGVQILPFSPDRLREASERWLRDRDLARETARVLDAYAAIAVHESDMVLVHGDLIADNIVIDEKRQRFVGMFDFSDAAVADRHLDLRYVHSFGRRFADELMQAYEERAGVSLDRGRPAVYHIAAAVSHLFLGIEADGAPVQRDRVERWIKAMLRDAF
jgi:aminoglycoside phosphotransferase